MAFEFLRRAPDRVAVRLGHPSTVHVHYLSFTLFE